MEKLLCGIDLGGTKLAAALVNTDGTIIDEIRTHSHVNKDEDGIVETMVDLLNSLLVKNNLNVDILKGIGVVFPGHIKCRDGVCITTSNLSAGFKGYPFRKNIQSYFRNTPVYVDNDANAQAYAEYKYGVGKGYNDMIFLTISTGIGGGIVIDGKLHRGNTGTAGEVGHMIINPNSTRKCTCGNYGCLMTQACGMFLADIALEKMNAGIKNDMGVTPENVYEKINGLSLENGLFAGDELATSVVYESADSVGLALYNLFQLYNPPIIVLGGGLINWGPIYLDRISQKFNSLAKDMIVDEMKIVPSLLGKNAGVLGAASLTLEHL